jgi:hypothetical protein
MLPSLDYRSYNVEEAKEERVAVVMELSKWRVDFFYIFIKMIIDCYFLQKLL